MNSMLLYCDESCHLKKDKSDFMVLGTISVPSFAKDEVYQQIRDIKIKHGFSSWFEVKWTKVSDDKLDFYKDLIDYFFECEYLKARIYVASSKNSLDHAKHNEDNYDVWYYKMYFRLLERVITPVNKYRIFIDIKDTLGGPRIKKLHDVLCNNIYDFRKDVINDIKQVNSHQSEILQLVDLLIGASSFYHRFRDTNKNNGKAKLINYLQAKYKIDLDHRTSPNEEKFNYFIWTPRG
jgi:hypothetical protein